MGKMNIEEIKEIIPHRYPFLLIDRVTELNGMESAKGYKNISVNEPIFQGHFPQNPIFPGVLILEALAQLGAVLVLRKFPKEKRSQPNTEAMQTRQLKNLQGEKASQNTLPAFLLQKILQGILLQKRSPHFSPEARTAALPSGKCRAKDSK